MSISALIDTGTCPGCRQALVVSVEFPFCRHCGWEAFDSIIEDDQDALLLDLPVRQEARKRWLLYLDEKATEEIQLQAAINTQIKNYEATQQQITALRAKIAEREKEIAELKEACAEMRKNFTLDAGVQLKAKDRDTIQKAKMEVHYHFRARLEIVRQQGSGKQALLGLWLNKALPENYDLALGISREPMRKIGDALLVVRVKLKPKDFQHNSSDNCWQAIKELPVGVLSEGKWYLKIAPMEQIKKNKISGRWVRATILDFADHKPGSPTPYAFAV